MGSKKKTKKKVVKKAAPKKAAKKKSAKKKSAKVATDASADNVQSSPPNQVASGTNGEPALPVSHIAPVSLASATEETAFHEDVPHEQFDEDEADETDDEDEGYF